MVPRYLVSLVALTHGLSWWQLQLIVVIAGVVGTIAAVAAYVFIPGVRQAVNEVTVAILKVALDAIWFVLKPLVDTVAGLVEFVGQFIHAVGVLLGGDLPRAIFRIVLIAAYLWVFELAKQIPVIGQIFDTILTTAQQVMKFANDLFDQAQRGLEALRTDLVAGLESVFKSFPELAAALKQDILQTVDSLIGPLESRLQTTRVELLARVDIVRQLLNTKVTVLGQTFSIVPDKVRQYLLSYETYHGRQALDEVQRIVEAGFLTGAPPSPQEAAPWAAVDQALEDMAAYRQGAAVDAAQAVQDAVDQMRVLARKELPELGDWPEVPEPPEPPAAPEPSIPIPPEIAVPA